MVGNSEAVGPGDAKALRIACCTLCLLTDTHLGMRKREGQEWVKARGECGIFIGKGPRSVVGNLRLGTRSTLSRWGPNSPLPPAPSHPPPLTVPPRSFWTTSLPHTIVPTHTLGSFPDHFRETLPVKETLSVPCPFFLTPLPFPCRWFPPAASVL